MSSPLFKLTAWPLITLLFFSKCNNRSSEQKMPPAGMHALDLSRYGKAITLFVPDTVKNKLTVTEQPSGALDVWCGKNFGIAIHEQKADLQLLRKDLREDEVNKLKTFYRDEPNALFWESEVVQPEFHFFVNQSLSGADYSFEDIKSTDNEPFSQAAVEQMFESALSVQPSNKKI